MLSGCLISAGSSTGSAGVFERAVGTLVGALVAGRQEIGESLGELGEEPCDLPEELSAPR